MTETSTGTTQRLPMTDDYHCPSCDQALTMPAPMRASRWRLGASIPPGQPVARTPEELAAQEAFDRADAVARTAITKLGRLEDETTWERDSRGEVIAGPWRFDSDPAWASHSRDVETATADRDVAYKTLRKARDNAADQRRQQVARDAEARDRMRLAAERDHRATRILEEGAVSIRDRVARLVGWS